MADARPETPSAVTSTTPAAAPSAGARQGSEQPAPGSAAGASDPFTAIAPAAAPPRRAVDEDVVQESTVIRPAGASLHPDRGPRRIDTGPATTGSHSVDQHEGVDQDDEERRGVPVWLLGLVAAVVVLGLGVSSALWVRATYSEKPKAPPTAAASTGAVDDEPLGKPGEVGIAPLDMPGAPVRKAQITWTAPEGFGEADHFEVRWDVGGADYAVYRKVKIVKGRLSTVRDMPPVTDQQVCVLVTAVRENGVAGDPERACIG